jgi:hypothetical protein
MLVHGGTFRSMDEKPSPLSVSDIESLVSAITPEPPANAAPAKPALLPSHPTHPTESTLQAIITLPPDGLVTVPPEAATSEAQGRPPPIVIPPLGPPPAIAARDLPEEPVAAAQPATPEPEPEPEAARPARPAGRGLLVVLIVIPCLALAIASVVLIRGRKDAAATSPSSSPQRLETKVAETQAPTTAAAAAAPLAETPSAATPPAPAVPDTDASAGGGDATHGEIRTTQPADGHRVFIDGRLVGEGAGAFSVSCGKHVVKIGSSGRPTPVEVACGASVTVP